MIAFFDIDGWFIMSSSLQDRRKIRNYKKKVPKSLRDAVRRHGPGKWRSGKLFLHHDNAPAHRTVTTNEFLAKHNIPSLPQPPYSPHHAQCYFFLLPQLKTTMKCHRFNYVQVIQANATRQPRAITKSDYQRCFRQWQGRWNKCMQAQRHYFEREKTD